MKGYWLIGFMCPPSGELLMSFLEARLVSILHESLIILENKYKVKRIQKVVEVYDGKLDELKSQFTISKLVSQRKKWSGKIQPTYSLYKQE